MNTRLDALRHQQSLLLQHLKWLEGEIAAASSGAVGAGNPPPRPPSAAPAGAPAPATIPDLAPVGPARERASGAALDTGAGLQLETMDSASIQRDVRKGCFIYAAGLAAALGLMVAIVYLVYR